jgi:hypothetical protein
VNIARINTATGVVENIEVATAAWMAANHDPAWTFVESPADKPAHIGLKYDPTTGFEQPPTAEPTLDDLKAQETTIQKKIADLEARK